MYSIIIGMMYRNVLALSIYRDVDALELRVDLLREPKKFAQEIFNIRSENQNI